MRVREISLVSKNVTATVSSQQKGTTAQVYSEDVFPPFVLLLFPLRGGMKKEQEMSRTNINWKAKENFNVKCCIYLSLDDCKKDKKIMSNTKWYETCAVCLVTDITVSHE